MTTTAPPTENRHPDTERWLDDLHIPWTFQQLPATKIDQGAGLANQARLEPLNAEVVDRYTADMQRGDQFPPIIVQDRGRTRALPLGGNHRLAAHLNAGHATVPAYVVETNPEQARRLIYEDNRRHGLPPSRTERIAQAVHLVETGWTIRDAAACVGIDEPTISTKRTVINAGRRATDLGVDRAFHTLPETSRYQLAQITSDPVFSEACRLAITGRLPAAAVTKLRKDIAAARSEADQLRIIGTETEERLDDIASTAGGKVRRTVTGRTKLMGSLTAIRGLSPAEVRASCSTSEQRADLNGWIIDATDRLTAISKALR